ncbi:MAG: succinate dehydrogenase, cytochrome b556 subunit [Chloroflexota bacterium]|nr:succinate dehydrogenase, cytochrome b556 subunit [Chloroflexota bacterium]
MLSYRGREGYWAWLLHRVSGVAIILFLFLHVLDTSLIGFGPAAYESFVFLYRLPVFRVMEVALAGAVLYHGINGIRIIAIDFIENATRIQRQLWYAVWASFLVLFLPAAYVMLKPVFFPTLALIP